MKLISVKITAKADAILTKLKKLTGRNKAFIASEAIEEKAAKECK